MIKCLLENNTSLFYIYAFEFESLRLHNTPIAYSKMNISLKILVIN